LASTNGQRRINGKVARDDEFTVKVSSKTEEVTMLPEQGFEWVGQKDNLIFLKKRK
jgi:hypothetical protein